MILSHIVAAARNNVIGANNDLPWKIPEDTKFFRDKTKGKALIMGRKTFESVGHPLPHRLNVVVTRNPDFKVESPQVLVVPTVDAAIEVCRAKMPEFGDEIFIIGGGEIYKRTLPLVHRIYLTRIHLDFPGDVTYPELDPKEWKLVSQLDRTEPVPFSFLTFERLHQP